VFNKQQIFLVCYQLTIKPQQPRLLNLPNSHLTLDKVYKNLSQYHSKLYPFNQHSHLTKLIKVNHHNLDLILQVNLPIKLNFLEDLNQFSPYLKQSKKLKLSLSNRLNRNLIQLLNYLVQMHGLWVEILLICL